MKSAIRLVASIAIFVSCLTGLLGTIAFISDGGSMMGINASIVGAALALFLLAGSAYILVEIVERLPEPAQQKSPLTRDAAIPEEHGTGVF